MVLRGSHLKENYKTGKNLLYGGMAGCISRTIIAPFDKIKILMQFEKTNLRFTTFFLNNLKKEGFF